MRAAQSFGAAHWLAQWARWKTEYHQSVSLCRARENGRLTFFNAILVRVLLVHWLSVISTSNTLNAFIEVVLRWSTGL